MPELIATCTANSYPDENGLVAHGYQLNIAEEVVNFVATRDLPDWKTFDREAAGRILADMGFTVQPELSADGWSPAGIGYLAVVTRTQGAAPSAGELQAERPVR